MVLAARASACLVIKICICNLNQFDHDSIYLRGHFCTHPICYNKNIWQTGKKRIQPQLEGVHKEILGKGPVLNHARQLSQLQLILNVPIRETFIYCNALLKAKNLNAKRSLKLCFDNFWRCEWGGAARQGALGKGALDHQETHCRKHLNSECAELKG